MRFPVSFAGLLSGLVLVGCLTGCTIQVGPPGPGPEPGPGPDDEVVVDGELGQLVVQARRTYAGLRAEDWAAVADGVADKSIANRADLFAALQARGALADLAAADEPVLRGLDKAAAAEAEDGTWSERERLRTLNALRDAVAGYKTAR